MWDFIGYVVSGGEQYDDKGEIQSFTSRSLEEREIDVEPLIALILRCLLLPHLWDFTMYVVIVATL